MAIPAAAEAAAVTGAVRAVYVVTGANSGVGLGIAECILADFHSGRVGPDGWFPNYAYPAATLLKNVADDDNYDSNDVAEGKQSNGREVNSKSSTKTVQKQQRGQQHRRLHPDPHPRITVVLACRNSAKADHARRQLLRKFYPSAIPQQSPPPGSSATGAPESPLQPPIDETSDGAAAVQTLLLDLSDPSDARRAARDIALRFPAPRYRLAALVFNAGAVGVERLSLGSGTLAFLRRPADLAGMSAASLVQTRGERTRDGRWGAAFAANFFGHFVLLKELLPELERSAAGGAGSVRVLWTSSRTADKKHFDSKDIQGLRNPSPYESAKYLIEQVAAAMAPSLREKGILSFVTDPGVVWSNIVSGIFPPSLLYLVILLFQLLGLSGISLNGRDAATPTRFLLTHPRPETLPADTVYECSTRLGSRLGVVLGKRLPVPSTLSSSSSSAATLLETTEGRGGRGEGADGHADGGPRLRQQRRLKQQEQQNRQRLSKALPALVELEARREAAAEAAQQLLAEADALWRELVEQSGA
ncbi:hypothetical protein DFJ73DRAFT_802236 [Zopfochytrium polystomum]|nr:hypothetical protein DFJ73DRAFT_802236 [Zopfochytrium polystomum]